MYEYRSRVFLFVFIFIFVPAVTAAISFRRSEVCNEIFTFSHLSNRSRLRFICVCGCSKRGVGVTLNGFSTRHAYIYMLMTSLQPLERVSMWNYSFNYRTKRECIWYQSKTEATRSSKTLSSCNLSDGNGKMGRKEHKDTVAV